MKTTDIIIAIDGHSSTGKSTFAKAIAAHFGMVYVDTGALYRGVALYAIRNGLINDQDIVDCHALVKALSKLDLSFKAIGPEGESRLFLNGENIENEIRGMDVAQKVSAVAKLPQVRSFVDNILKGYGTQKGIVMEGRDIGTVVFPNAEVKIFMTAKPEIRAMRRYNELIESGRDADYNEVLKNIVERDYTDENRATAPLRRAEDAVLLDNSNMTGEDQMKWIEQLLSQMQIQVQKD